MTLHITEYPSGEIPLATLVDMATQVDQTYCWSKQARNEALVNFEHKHALGNTTTLRRPMLLHHGRWGDECPKHQHDLLEWVDDSDTTAL